MCGTCGDRHTPPTGLKCPYSDFIRMDKFELAEPSARESAQLGSQARDMASRMDQLEEAVLRIERSTRRQSSRFEMLDPPKACDLGADLDSEDLCKPLGAVGGIDSHPRSPSAERSQRQLMAERASLHQECNDPTADELLPDWTLPGAKKKTPFARDNLLEEGECVSDFQSLMLVTFRTIEHFISQGYEPGGVVRHGLILAENAVTKAYTDKALMVFDTAVRNRANTEGPRAFGRINTEDSLRSFCYENSLEKERLDNQSRQKAARKSTERYCYRFNGDGCNDKKCIYAHKCAVCGDKSHSRKDCREKKVNQK